MNETVYLATIKGNESCRYEFSCIQCGYKVVLLTGEGRYGNLGAFECPHCGKQYYATRDDYMPGIAKGYVYEYGKQTAGYLSGNKNPLFTLMDVIGKEQNPL